jgi:ribosomal protein L37E
MTTESDVPVIYPDLAFVRCDRCGWTNLATGDFCCGCGIDLSRMRNAETTGKNYETRQAGEG